MKRFEFSLAPVLQYKITVENLQKAELTKAQNALRLLYEEQERLRQAYDRTVASQNRAVEENDRIPASMARHDAFFRFLRGQNEELAKKIAEAEREKERCRKQLVRTMKEIQTYEDLREAQYEEYLEEVRLEEAKEVGDIVSHKTITG